jgi:hypothetical protein
VVDVVDEQRLAGLALWASPRIVEDFS